MPPGTYVLKLISDNVTLASDDVTIKAFEPITTSLDTKTTGTYELYFDGSDMGLDVDNTDENVDVIAFADEGILISTSGSLSVPGLSATVSGNDEDLIVFTPSGFGSETEGTWAMYFDGSDAGLHDGGNAEDINGAMIDPYSGKIFLSTLGSFFVPGASGDGSDIFFCVPSSIGSKTACITYAPFFDGSIHGLDTTGEVIDGFVLR